MRQLICRRTCEWLEIGYTYRAVRISYLVRLAEVGHIQIGYCKITTCYRALSVAFFAEDAHIHRILQDYYVLSASGASPTLIVQWGKIFVIYIYMFFIYIYMYIRSYVVHARATHKRRTGRLRFNGQYNRLKNGYFSSKL